MTETHDGVAVLCRGQFTFAEVVGGVAHVPAALSDGLSGVRGEFDWRLWAEDTTESPNFRVQAPPGAEPIMWMKGFFIECSGTVDRGGDVAQEAFNVMAEISLDVMTVIALNNPYIWFAGAHPELVHHVVTVDGMRTVVDTARLVTGGVMVYAPDSPTKEDFVQAGNGDSNYSRERIMVAQAMNHGLFNRDADPRSAIIFAAAACEIAIHHCARRLQIDDVSKRLVGVTVGDGKGQAPLSPKSILQAVIPALGGPDIVTMNAGLWNRINSLFSERNSCVHTGVRKSVTVGHEKLIHAAKELIDLLESY